MILRITALILGALLAVPALAQSLEIIQLKNRPADQVLPVVRPLLEPGASASGSGFQLFVRTSAANLAQIRQVVASLDRAVRQLVIYVKEDADGAGASAGMEDRTYSNRDNAARQVRAQEGIPAFIASSTASRLNTGRAPGRPRQTGHTLVFGSAPKPVGQPQNILVRVPS